MKRLLLLFTILILQVHGSSIVSRELPREISPTQRSILMSPRKKFVLGLFKPAPDRWFLGIWHRNLPKEVVWVANRNTPLSQPRGILKILNNTKIALLDQYGTQVWSSKEARKLKSPLVGEILDNGNFVLRIPSSNELMWQSFDYLGDALISNMILGWDARSNMDRVLCAWRREDDPGKGQYTYGVERNDLVQSFIRGEDGVPTFRSDPWETKNDVEESSKNLSYGTYSIMVSETEATYSFNITKEGFFSILRLTDTGLLWRSTWNLSAHGARKLSDTKLPQDTCSYYKTCGANGLCAMKKSPMCNCLQGFEPRDAVAWQLRDWKRGCERKTKLSCDGTDGFIKMETMKLPDTAKSIVDRRIGVDECKKRCLEDCNCTAYANADMQNGGYVIWVGELLDLRENNFAGQPVFIKLSATDIEGMLSEGRAIAVKRLLKKSARGIEGFINEVNLIASVQHINLVQLLGDCFERDENILVFEYLENSSLDTYIFDKTRSSMLDWEKRLQIIIGTARGLSYLHQDSRIRIIHLDLKPSNILLDKDMTPKISDFGIAKQFKRDETEAHTTKINGTFGYICPEAIAGKYSAKSDTFSFGVLFLEIITGERSTDFFNLKEKSLLSHIWRKWKEGKGLDVVDPVIVGSVQPYEVLRCIQIALLCVQELAEDRPAMSLVLSMLTSERIEIDQPQPPDDFTDRNCFEIGSSSTYPQDSWTMAQVSYRTV